MFGLDEAIAGAGGGDAGLAVALLVALLLGLRHASDPDHVAAVSTLVMSGDARGPRRAAGLGVAWGLGHAVSLLALGLPIVLFDAFIPSWVQHALEATIGVVIVVLGVRLLLRRRRTARRPAHGAFGIGLVHGAGGSAAVCVLLIAAVPGQGTALAALLVLAAGTAASMAALSALWGYALVHGPVLRSFDRSAPAVGALSVTFGLWYGLAAFGAVPYGL